MIMCGTFDCGILWDLTGDFSVTGKVYKKHHELTDPQVPRLAVIDVVHCYFRE